VSADTMPATPAAGADEPLAYWPAEESLQRRAVIRDFLHEHHDPARVRASVLGDQPYDQNLWQRLAADMGVAAIMVPERLGGLGLGYEDLAVVAGELGRVLYSGPFFGTEVLALGALLSAADAGGPATAAAEALIRQVAEGQTAALAFMDADGRWDSGSPGVAAVEAIGGWELTGRRHLVVDALSAEVLCVLATIGADPALFAVKVGDAQVESVESIDPTRALGVVAFQQARGELLARGQAASRAIDAAVQLARLVAAAECAAGAEEALRLMVDYAQSRRQFGRPIGSFQAVKHKCADALIVTEAAKAVTSYAAWALDDGSPEAGPAVLAAKIAGTRAFVKTAADCIQVHGTFGYTREALPQSYYRRARWLSLFLGSEDEDSQQLADLLGL
jgi:alkylation response protein AidB-like acyl-CoA dehydrogenase